MNYKIISKLIQTAPNFTVVKVYDFLVNAEKFNDGVVGTKKYVSDKIKITSTSVIKAFKWLEDNNYITETTVNGIPKFIINENIDFDEVKSKNVNTENNKQNTQIITKGGKTITRMMVEGF